MNRFRQIRSVIRLHPFDVSTPEGLSRERYRRILLTSLTSLLSKGVSLLLVLVSVPLTIDYLGTERFGLWMIISSFSAFLAFADLGIGNGLLNGISEAEGKSDMVLAKRYVSSSFFMMMGMALVLLVAFWLAYPFVPWHRVFNVSSDRAAREAGPALAIFWMSIVISLPLGTVQRVQLGRQEGFLSNVWQIAANVSALVGLLIAVQFRGSLSGLVLVSSGIPVLVTAVNWVHYFRITKPVLSPSISAFNWSTGWALARTGLIFMLLQVFALAWFQIDNLLLACLLGASAVTEYAIAQRLFSVAMVAQFFIIPLWPAYGEAIARSDYHWARRTFSRAMFLSLLITAGLSLPLVLFGREIVIVWLGAETGPSWPLMIGLAILNLLIVGAGNLSSLLVHGSNLQRQLLFYGAASIIACGLKVLLVTYWGVPGVVWGAVLAFGLVYTPFALRLAYDTFRLKGVANERAGS